MVSSFASVAVNIEQQRVLHAKCSPSINKESFGQFFTPYHIASFMASLFPNPESNNVFLLDPGAGIGSLSTAFVEKMASQGIKLNIEIDCFELDTTLLTRLNENLNSFTCITESLYNVINKDFIKFATDYLLSFNKPKYTHAILNPPYQKILSSSLHRKLMSSVDIEVVNLYSAFTSLAIELLKENGHIVAILPRSFCNGTYFLPFRKHLFANTVIQQIHIFKSRKSVFSDDSVLQENVIIHLKKTNQVDSVIVSYSENSDLSDIESIVYPYSEIVDLDSRELVISIPIPDAINRVTYFRTPLSKLGINVSTGPVVDFRNQEYITAFLSKKQIPLIYPFHFNQFQIAFPRHNPKKLESIQLTSETKRLLYPKGFYVLVKRFSSKEEKRRIVAVIFKPEDFNSDLIAFENHLNVFHNKNEGLDEDFAYGLLCYLNSEGCDIQFRLFSGHTQVNAGDLKRMTYPDSKTLISIGKKLKHQNLSYTVFEELIEEYQHNATK